MEKHIVELFKKGDFWCAVLGQDSHDGSFGSGRSMAEALRRLASDMDCRIKTGGNGLPFTEHNPFLSEDESESELLRYSRY